MLGNKQQVIKRCVTVVYIRINARTIWCFTSFYQNLMFALTLFMLLFNFSIIFSCCAFFNFYSCIHPLPFSTINGNKRPSWIVIESFGLSSVFLSICLLKKQGGPNRRQKEAEAERKNALWEVVECVGTPGSHLTCPPMAINVITPLHSILSAPTVTVAAYEWLPRRKKINK